MNKKIMVALDDNDPQEALRLAQQLNPDWCYLKVGKNLFTRAGTQMVEQLHGLNHQIFLDLKFHDIPNTVATAVKAGAELGVFMINVHASGGIKMMKEAKEALSGFKNPPLLIGVTVLTSQTQGDLDFLGIKRTLTEQVVHLAQATKEAGLDGVVCSAQEADLIKSACGADFLTVCPGIRPSWAVANDQRRIHTPSEALRNGADYLVIGRPITQAHNPLEALNKIREEIAHA